MLFRTFPPSPRSLPQRVYRRLGSLLALAVLPAHAQDELPFTIQPMQETSLTLDGTLLDTFYYSDVRVDRVVAGPQTLMLSWVASEVVSTDVEGQLENDFRFINIAQYGSRDPRPTSNPREDNSIGFAAAVFDEQSETFQSVRNAVGFIRLPAPLSAPSLAVESPVDTPFSGAGMVTLSQPTARQPIRLSLELDGGGTAEDTAFLTVNRNNTGTLALSNIRFSGLPGESEDLEEWPTLQLFRNDNTYSNFLRFSSGIADLSEETFENWRRFLYVVTLTETREDADGDGIPNLTDPFVSRADPFPTDSIPMALSWYWVRWLDDFLWSTGSPWDYATEQGWIYPASDDPDDVWYFMHTDMIGWVWTNQDLFPLVYSHSAESWLRLEPTEERTFRSYNYTTTEWQTHSF